jgi:hypothetical protein
MANLIDEIKQRVGATQIEMAKYVKIAPIEKENVSRGWVNFGEANMYPQYLIELQSESPVHGSIVNSISQMIAGKGVSGGNDTANAYLSGLKIDSIIPHISRDLKLFGGYYLEVIWSMDRTTIAQVNHLPFENCRLACSDENDDLIGVWYSRDWSDMRKKKNTPHFIPMFDEENKETCPKQVLFIHTLKMGSEYYPKPDYIGSVNYIELTRQIGEYHVNNILNGFFPSLIASFNNGIPSLEEQHMIKNQLQMSIQGAENAGKVLTFFNEERDRGVEFTAFPINDADKQYQFLSEECTKQIMIAHRVTSPLLFGVRDGGGLGSNTDEMRTALFIFQRQVIEPFQRLIEDGISIICEASNVVATPKIISNEILEVQPVEAQQSAVKKKVECEHQSVSKICCSAGNDFTDEEGRIFIDELKSKAEYIDVEEWELISEEDVLDPENELNYTSQLFNKMPSMSDANGGDKSQWGDAGLYKLRYAYSQNLSANSREFCVEMVGLSKAGAVFRYEDIENMSEKGVNGDFAPTGASTYSIFRYLGGSFCHHFWKRQIYMRKRDSKGRILPNEGLENDKRVANNPFVPRKGIEGIAPINRPGRGSLKYQ